MMRLSLITWKQKHDQSWKGGQEKWWMKTKEIVKLDLSTDKEGFKYDFEKVSTDRPIVSTDESKVSTDEQVEGTEEHNEGTEEQRKDDETIVHYLLNLSQAKAASKGKRERIDPKDKGKKKIEEEDESESEDDDIPQAVKKFKQLASDEELTRKVQEEWEAEEERNRNC
ncbi:hypothetical protein Tco_0611100 [Tanacetum coccineum]